MAQSNSLQTINVIKIYHSTEVSFLKSFKRNNEGLEEAENLFVEFIKELNSDVSQDDIVIAKEDGFYSFGRWVVLISDSM